MGREEEGGRGGGGVTGKLCTDCDTDIIHVIVVIPYQLTIRDTWALIPYHELYTGQSLQVPTFTVSVPYAVDEH